VVTDPNAALAVVLMAQHIAAGNPHPQYAMAAQNDLEHANLANLISAEAQARDAADDSHVAAANPHPQYALAAQNDLEHANLVTLIAGVVQALQQHENALNPHPQYAFASEINPRHLFRFIHNTGGPYDTHYGVAAGGVVHDLEGIAHPLGDCLQDYDPIEVSPVNDYEVQGITLGGGLNRQGFLLRFDGYIQFGNYAGQWDTGFGTPSVKLLLLDDAAQVLVEIPLTLTHMYGNFANNGNVGHVMYRLSKDFDLYNLRKADGQIPTMLYAALSAQGTSDSDGGSPDLQILSIESFSILCGY
jgi:hypothetical protein